MTFKTGRAVIRISLRFMMLIVHVGLIVIMTINACKLDIVGGIGMALYTIIPCFSLVVFPGIYRK